MRQKLKVTYQGTPLRLSDLSTENFQARREWDGIVRILKEKAVNQELYTRQSCPSEMKDR